MKKCKKMTVVLLSLALTVSSVTLSNPTSASAAKKMSLSTKKLTVKVGQSKKLKLKNNKKKVTWKVISGKKNITLKSKKKTEVTVVGKKKGNAKVQAKIDKKKYTCKVTVKVTVKKEKATKYNYEVKFLNQPYTGLRSIVYIKTNNPSADYFSVKLYNMKGKEVKLNHVVGNQYDDIKYKTDEGICKVKGGYLDFYRLAHGKAAWKAGKYKVVIEESVRDAKGNSVQTDDLGYIDVRDYIKEREAWMRSVINEVTTSSMTKKEKMRAITDYMYKHSVYYKTIYSETSTDGFRYAELATQVGIPVWKSSPYEFDSYDSPAMLVTFGKMINYPLINLYGKYAVGTAEWRIWHMKAQSVEDGSYYQFCHVPDNWIDEASIKQINLSTWNFYECYK